jgi:hypothetical protein
MFPKLKKESVMKTKKVVLILCVVLFCSGTLLYAKSDSIGGRPRIGILLDTEPLPDLLIKHLRLEPGQGIRIRNVQEDSPADKAGLQRDDIIIGFEGKDVKSNKQLIDAVQEAGIGAEVSLKIIHLGKRKTIELHLEAIEGKTEWKYPSEPEVFQSWRPGRIFRFKPGDKNWMEIDMPLDKSLEVYEYHYSNDEGGYSVTIEGNPEDKDTLITVRIGNDSYQTTVGEIENLPEKYREDAQKALEDSLKHSKQRMKENETRRFYNMLEPDELTRKKLDDAIAEILKERRIVIKPYDPNNHLKNLEDHLLRHPPDLPKFEPDKRMFDKIEEQMRKLQERIEELEKRFKDTTKQLSKPESKKEQI